MGQPLPPARPSRAGALVAFVGLLTAVVTFAFGDGLYYRLPVPFMPPWSVWVLVGAVCVAGSIWSFRKALDVGRRSSEEMVRRAVIEVQAARRALQRVQAEVEQNQRLAQLNAEQAEAVKNLVEAVQGRASKLGGRQQWMFFIAGLLASVPLGVVGNFVFEIAKEWLVSY